MPYMNFHKDGKSYEIDLEIMDRIGELQAAVLELQATLEIDTSRIAALISKDEAHAAEMEARLLAESALEEESEAAMAALLSSGPELMMM